MFHSENGRTAEALCLKPPRLGGPGGALFLGVEEHCQAWLELMEALMLSQAFVCVLPQTQTLGLSCLRMMSCSFFQPAILRFCLFSFLDFAAY